MSEEGTDIGAEGQEENVGSEQAQTTPIGTEGADPNSISNFIDTDGTFKEGWRDNLLPEEARHQGIYDRVKDVKGLLNLAGNQEKAISKKGVIPIDENSSDTEKALYREVMGVPKTAQDYKLEVPPGTEEYYGQELVQEAMQELHGVNLTQAQFNKVMELDARRLIAMHEEGETIKFQSQLDAEAAIDREFGDKKDTAIRHANLAVNEVTKTWDPADREKLFGTTENPAGINDPEFSELKPLFLRFISDFGSYFTEDGGIQSGRIADPDTLDDQIGQLTAKLTEDLHRTNRKEYNKILEQRDSLYKKRYPEP